jgi:hypothetical protein
MAKGTGKKSAGINTQWAAQFLVAAELTRRGYTVSFTMGNNTPLADLMVGAASGKMFWVDVKGLAQNSPWLLRPKPERPELFYVLVYLTPLANQPDVRQPDRFFILTQSEANTLVSHYAKTHPGDRGTMPGFGFKDPHSSEDAWLKLPV